MHSTLAKVTSRQTGHCVCLYSTVSICSHKLCFWIDKQTSCFPCLSHFSESQSYLACGRMEAQHTSCVPSLSEEMLSKQKLESSLRSQPKYTEPQIARLLPASNSSSLRLGYENISRVKNLGGGSSPLASAVGRLPHSSTNVQDIQAALRLFYTVPFPQQPCLERSKPGQSR